jgi:MoxR-like ATPase
MVEKVIISGVELILTEAAEVDLEWVGNEDTINELKAAWMIVDKEDLPLNPRILGKPGVGKTTLAYATGKRLNKPVYIFQCTMDTRPEDLLISPVISSDNQIAYVASSLVSAMIKGGVCLLDEGNRMSEKSWASLAPLMDKRRYVDSIIAGIRIYAHKDFRLQPKIMVEFPNRVDETKILSYNLPFTSEEILAYCVDFLQNSHIHDEPYTVRDGINIIRYYMKNRELNGKNKMRLNKREFKKSILQVLEPIALRYCSDEYEKYIKEEESESFPNNFF